MNKFKQHVQAHWNALHAQKRNRALLMIGILAIVLGWVLLSPEKKDAPKVVPEKTTLTLVSDTVPIEDLWLYRSEQKLNDNSRVLESLQADMAKMKSNDASSDVDALQTQLNELKALFEAREQHNENVSEYTREPDFKDGIHYSDSLVMNEPRILNQSFALTSTTSLSKTSKDYIPLGSFAKGILLNGLDASTATTASSNPLPVLMRLTSDAILPRQFKGQMKTCHVIAGAYGELSTTRVMMRLETITCTDKEGNIFESTIEGYVTGDDGRVGVLGTLRDDTNPLLAKSFAAGLLGGIGQGIADSTGTTSTSALGTVQTYDTNEIFKLGLGEGASSALDRLAQYYIERAEQIYPVIQVEPGRLITLVISGSHGLTLSNTTLSEETP